MISAPQVREQAVNSLWAVIWLVLGILAMRDALVLRDIQGVVYFALHLQVAVLFVIRQGEAVRSSHALGYVVAIVSTLYVYGYDFQPEQAGVCHPLGPMLTFAGSLTCFAATWSLGKCFGVLPICRGVRTHNMYRVVRHPIYTSYMLMDIGIVLAFPSAWNILVFLGGIVLFVARIYYEEDVMRGLPQYGHYCKRMKFRLIPGVY